MIHIALTCPRLGFTLGLYAEPQPGRRAAEPVVAAAVETLGGPVRRGAGWYDVELADSVDAMLAFDALARLLPSYELVVCSITASHAAVELLADPVAKAVWDPLRAQIRREDDIDLSRAFSALRFYRELVAWRVPDEIAEHRLPTAPLVLWWLGRGVIAVDHEPFTIGRDPTCDFAVEAETLPPIVARFVRSNDGWTVESVGTRSLTIDSRRPLQRGELRPGHVVQIVRPHALLVLSVQPAR